MCFATARVTGELDGAKKSKPSFEVLQIAVGVRYDRFFFMPQVLRNLAMLKIFGHSVTLTGHI
jgi:hypothetical protein